MELDNRLRAAGSPGWHALVVRPGGNRVEHPVVQWVPAEDELVGYIQDDTGRIVRADRLPGFAGYARSPVAVAALPGMGWTVRFAMDDGTEESRPVLAWLVYDDGTVIPQDADDDGLVYASSAPSNFLGLIPPSTTSNRVTVPAARLR